MIKKNNQTIGTIYKGLTPIEKIYKGGILVWEGWKTLIAQGIPPISLQKCKENNLLDYQIYGNSKQGELPEGYTQLEYIESTGEQYIDTGYIFNSTNYKANIDIVLTNTTISPQRIMGAYDGTNRSLLITITTANGIYGQFGTGSQYVNSASNIFDTNKHNIQIEQTSTTGILSIDGTTYSNTLTSTPSKAGTTVHLFHSNGNTQYLYAKIYNCKIYDNDTLVRNFIPCKNSSGTIGMYDIVSNTFYENQGTGTFIAGPEMPNPDSPIEIQSVGDKTKNLFNKNTVTWTDGFYINANGVVVQNTYNTFESSISSLIKLNPNTEYIISGIKKSNAPVGNTFTRIHLFDSDGNWIKQLNYANNNSKDVSILFTTENDYYIKISLTYEVNKEKDLSELQIEEGSTATDYEPYGYKIPVSVKHNIFDKNNTIRYRAYININNNFVGGTSDSSSVAIACLPNKTYKIIKYIDTAIYRACYINDEMPELGKTTPAYNVQSETNDEIIVTTGENAKYVVIQCANALYESFIDTLEVIDEETTTNIYLDEPLRKIGNADAVKLPSDYKQLEYIESTGTQYIDTEFVGNNNSRILIDFYADTMTQNTALFGSRDSSNENSLSSWYINSVSVATGKLRADYYSSTSTSGIYQFANSDTGNRYLLDYNKNTVTMGNDSHTFTETTFSTPSNILLLTCNLGTTADTRRWKGKIYSCKIYDNNVLTRDFIPCINDQNVVGLYDIVNDTFYTNQGAGTFVAGPQIYADYIDYENQKVVRNVIEITFDENSAWEVSQASSNRYACNFTENIVQLPATSGVSVGHSLCNLLQNKRTVWVDREDVNDVGYILNNKRLICRFGANSSLTSLELLKTYLASNNLKLYCELATPTEESIELPDILLNKGTNVVDVETSLKPSNLWLKYKGKN